MSHIVNQLANLNPEFQDSYGRIQAYWESTISKLLGMDRQSRQNHYLGCYMDFITTYYHDIERITCDIEEKAKSLLGCILKVDEGPELIISMVEIYADGIWDTSGDLVKGLFQNDLKVFKKETNCLNQLYSQVEKGNSIFLSKLFPGPRLYFYNGRLDIVLFDKFLPFSLLIRQFRNKNNELVDFEGSRDGFVKSLKSRKFDEQTIDKYGSAGIQFESIGKKSLDRLKEISNSASFRIGSSDSPVQLFDRDNASIQNLSHLMRVEGNRATGLNGLYKYHEWNLSLNPEHLI